MNDQRRFLPWGWPVERGDPLRCLGAAYGGEDVRARFAEFQSLCPVEPAAGPASDPVAADDAAIPEDLPLVE